MWGELHTDLVLKAVWQRQRTEVFFLFRHDDLDDWSGFLVRLSKFCNAFCQFAQWQGNMSLHNNESAESEENTLASTERS